MAKSHRRLTWLAAPAALTLLAAAPAAAQVNAADAAPPPAAPAPADNIGPRELSNFSLNGTVTREAQPPAEPRTSAPAQAPAPRAAAPAATARTDRQTADRAAPPAARPAAPTADLDSMARRPSLAPAAPRADASPFADSGAPAPLSEAQPSGFSPLPWIAALFLLAAGAAAYFGLQRRRQRPAAAAAGSGVSAFLGEPRPAPPAPGPVRSPPPADPLPAEPPLPDGRVTSRLRAPGKAPVPSGIVSSSLRPWIELELEPSQALVTDEQAAIAFDVTLFNSGSAPARDVAVEACLLNAGDQQDVQLSRFYTAPSAARDKIPTVAPLARITLKSAVRLPRESVQEYEVEGRKLFMPMVAVNSRYRWSSGEGQSAASFLVGRAANDSGKLAPLRLDQGARGWRKLAARRYEKGIRK